MSMMVPPVTVPSGPTNVRQKIAPANAALIQSMRVRDPRLLRQPTPTSGQNTSQLLPTDHMYNHKSISEANGPRKLTFPTKTKNTLADPSELLAYTNVRFCSNLQLVPFLASTTTTL